MKVLFLDFDGVLNGHYPGNRNSDDDYYRIERKLRNFISSNFSSTKPNAPRLHSVFNLKREMVDILNHIVVTTDCNIVFSTSWRGDGVTNLALYLVLSGFIFPENCIDRTPYVEGYVGTTRTNVRGLEIKEWLSRHPEVESFVIVDDEDFDIKDYYQDEVVKVKGLTLADANTIIRKLNKWE